MWKLDFEIVAKKGNARAGKIHLNWKTIKTPVFMPVGTKATIKWMILDLLNKWEFTGADVEVWMILANTFHLYLSPWDEFIRDVWWLHNFQNWDGLILTDSGWFQVFSLWLGSKNKSWNSLVNLQNNWVEFASPRDGSKHFFSPEKVVDIQMNFWSDIMMVLDVCSPVNRSNKEDIKKQMDLTHYWADKSFEYFEKKYQESNWVLFPIVQGWLYEDLRKESVEYLSQYAWDWIAVWGVSVWETREEMYQVTDWVGKELPENKPRYLMWVWTPEDIYNTIYLGMDMFDCVLPTRLARHGFAFSSEWNIKILKSENKYSMDFLDKNCKCYTCRNFSRAYLRHLFKEKEMLGPILLTLHNISYLAEYVENIRNEIIN